MKSTFSGSTTIGSLPPSLIHWTIRYDKHWQMPEQMQGVFVGASEKYKSGAALVMGNILSIDMQNKTMTLDDGQVFNLIGKGKRMIILDEQEVIEEMMNISKKRLEDDNDLD